MNSAASEDIQKVFIDIPGITHILAGKNELNFRSRDGLNIILLGPAGSGKTLFALQMAVKANNTGTSVIYLTKDMPPEGIVHRIDIFKHFGESELRSNFTLLNSDLEERFIKSKARFEENLKKQEDEKKKIELEKEFKKGYEFIYSKKPFFAVANLNLSTIPPLAFRSDIWQQPLLYSLLYLCPHLQEIFREMHKKYEQEQHNLMIVIDSLSNELLLECLQKQAERPNGTNPQLSSRSVNVFVSEFTSLPEEPFATYPPDLHFQFDIRDEGHGYSTKTIQVKKSRMQEVRHEAFPFVIVDAKIANSLNRMYSVTVKKPDKYVQYFWKISRVEATITEWMESKIPLETGQKLNDFLQFNMCAPINKSWPKATIFINNGKNNIKTAIDFEKTLQKNDIVYSNEKESEFDFKEQPLPEGVIIVLSDDEVDKVPEDDPKDNNIVPYQNSCPFHSRNPGITILPSLADATLRDLPDHKSKDYHPVGIRFGIPDIDRLTYEGRLDSNCSTLLVTENRCYSGFLGLHYLLGDIGLILQKVDEGESVISQKIESNFKADEVKKTNQEIDPPCLWQTTPRSVLYIALDNDLNNILYDICKFSTLRTALWETTPSDVELQQWIKSAEESTSREKENTNEEKVNKIKQSRHEVGRLYSIPLRHVSCSYSPLRGGASYLYILIPTLSWTTAEEILERIQQLLDYSKHQNCPLLIPDMKCNNLPCRERCSEPNCKEKNCIDFFPGHCLTIDRVLFNRVGSLASRWPLIHNSTLFVSNLAQMCLNAGADLMIVDDTAVQSSTSGHLSSQWSNYTRNIIRLKRVQFHGNETVLFEMVRVGSRNLITTQPQELRVHEEPGINSKTKISGRKLELRDSFRGFTQLFSGAPQRCKVAVDLAYDQVDTPLYQDVLTIRHNLESLMGEEIKVNLFGPEGRIGVNSALANLAYVTQDTCHITTIDEVWLHRIIGTRRQPSGLINLSARDFISAKPEYQFIINPYTHTWEEYKQDTLSLRTFVRLLAGFPDSKNVEKLDNTLIELVCDRYVTEALSLAYKKGKRDREIRAIPYRHNWGVFTTVQPFSTRLRRLVDTYMKYSRSLVRDDDKWAWQVIGYVLDEEYADISLIESDIPTIIPLATNFVKTNLVKIITQLWSAIWKSQDGDAVDFCWDDLINFKRYVWNVVVPPIQRLISDFSSTPVVTKDTSDNPELILLKRHLHDIDAVYFFDCDRSSDESLVSFFLELLLSHEDIETIFTIAEDPLTENPPSTASLLKFKVKEKESSELLKEAFARTLIRMHQLFSRRQRYEIQAGLLPEYKQEYSDLQTDTPPLSYALFAREWLSTVPRLTNPFDLRERIKILHLPAGKKDNGTHLHKVINFEAKERISENEIKKSIQGLFIKNNSPNSEDVSEKTIGVSVSGMWYLGAMSGGNEELAADVIREILSDYHERERMIAHCAAPVQHHFYEGVNENSTLLASIPYSKIVATVYKKKRDYYSQWKESILKSHFGNQSTIQQSQEDNTPSKETQPTFPFTRSRIIEYTYSSLLLVKLIRNAMKMESTMMKYLYDDGRFSPDQKTNQNKEYKKKLDQLLDPVIYEINQIYQEYERRLKSI
jgi:hypothetical protein